MKIERRFPVGGWLVGVGGFAAKTLPWNALANGNRQSHLVSFTVQHRPGMAALHFTLALLWVGVTFGIGRASK